MIEHFFYVDKSEGYIDIVYLKYSEDDHHDNISNNMNHEYNKSGWNRIHVKYELPKNISLTEFGERIGLRYFNLDCIFNNYLSSTKEDAIDFLSTDIFDIIDEYQNLGYNHVDDTWEFIVALECFNNPQYRDHILSKEPTNTNIILSLIFNRKKYYRNIFIKDFINSVRFELASLEMKDELY